MAALVLALAIFVSVVRQAAVADLVGGEYRSELTTKVRARLPMAGRAFCPSTVGATPSGTALVDP